MTDIHELIRQAESERRTHLHIPGLVEYDRPIVLTRDSSIRRITGDGISEERTSRTEPSVGLVYSGAGTAIRFGEPIEQTRERGMIGVSVENLQLTLTNPNAEWGIMADHCPHLAFRRVHLSGVRQDSLTLFQIWDSYSAVLDDVTFCLSDVGMEVFDSHWLNCRTVNCASIRVGVNFERCNHCHIDGLQLQAIEQRGVGITGCQHTALRDVRCEWQREFDAVDIDGRLRMSGWTTIENADVPKIETQGVVQKLAIRSSHVRKLVTDSHRAAKEWERDRLSEIDQIEGRAPFHA